MNIPRDRWGNPLIPSPFPTGQPVAHKRPSGITGKIDDIYNLRQWEQRMAVKGTAENPELLAMAHSLDPDDADDRRAFGELLKRAKEAAGSLTGANRGTTMHTYVRRKLAGEDVQPLPDYAPGLELYLSTLDAHGITPVLLEQFVVWPDKFIAGSCDLYAEYKGRTVVMDLKTGAHDPTSWSMVAYSAQLACYANATHQWDGETATELPDVDTDVAYLLWLPYQGGRCELIEVDVAKGAHWVDLALEIDAAHKDKNVGRHIAAPDVAPTSEGAAKGPAAQVPTAPATAAPSSFRDPIRDGIARCTARIGALIAAGVEGDHIRSMWPDGVAPLKDGPTAHTEESLDAIEATLMLLEMEAGLSKAIDEAVDAMIERLKVLPSDLLMAVEAEAKASEPPIPNLRSGRATQDDLDRLETIVASAENEASERFMQLTNALSPLAPGEADAIVEWATEQRGADEAPALAELTDLEAERAVALAELYQDRHEDREALLVAEHGTKSEVLRAARIVATRHDLPAPKSTADVAGDRVLCALTIHNQKAAQ